MASRLRKNYSEELFELYPWFTFGYFKRYQRLYQLERESDPLFLERVAAKLYSREPLYKFVEGERIREEQRLLGRSSEGGEELQFFEVSSELVEEKMEEGALSEEIAKEVELIELEQIERPKMRFWGGDYFSPEELDSLELDDSDRIDSFIVERPSLLRGALLRREEEAAAAEREVAATAEKGEVEVTAEKGEVEEVEEKVEVKEFDEGSFKDEEFYTEALAQVYADQGFYKRALEVYAKLILLNPEKNSYFASLIKEIKSKRKK